ncbi:hypothetical protein ACJX0J_026417, partial [Zea mays]
QDMPNLGREEPFKIRPCIIELINVVPNVYMCLLRDRVEILYNLIYLHNDNCCNTIALPLHGDGDQSSGTCHN